LEKSRDIEKREALGYSTEGRERAGNGVREAHDGKSQGEERER